MDEVDLIERIPNQDSERVNVYVKSQIIIFGFCMQVYQSKSN